MELILGSIIDFFSNVYHSQAMAVIKFLMGIYLVILIADIILLGIARGIGANVRYMLYGGDFPADLGAKKKKTRQKWDALKKMLESEKESDWKIMIINADEMLFQLIRKLGYKGENMGEVLANVQPGHLEGIERVKESHEMRNRIVHEEDFKLELEVATDIMEGYETFLEFFDV